MNLFEKIKRWAGHNHGLVMILCCAIPIIFVLAVLPLFGANSASLPWLIFLLCPLLHIIMMRGMMNGSCHGGHNHKESTEKDDAENKSAENKKVKSDNTKEKNKKKR